MITSFGSALFANVKFLVQQSDCHISIASIGLETSLQLLIYLNMHYLIMLQSHAHLRTLWMVRKARLHLSIHSITIRITSAESVTVRNLSQRPFHPRPNFEKKKKGRGYLQLTVNSQKTLNGYLQLTVNSQKTLKWLFTVDCQ